MPAHLHATSTPVTAYSDQALRLQVAQQKDETGLELNVVRKVEFVQEAVHDVEAEVRTELGADGGQETEELERAERGGGRRAEEDTEHAHLEADETESAAAEARAEADKNKLKEREEAMEEALLILELCLGTLSEFASERGGRRAEGEREGGKQ